MFSVCFTFDSLPEYATALWRSPIPKQPLAHLPFRSPWNRSSAASLAQTAPRRPSAALGPRRIPAATSVTCATVHLLVYVAMTQRHWWIHGFKEQKGLPPFGWTLKAFSPSKKRREKENKKNTRSVLDTNPEAAPGPKGDLDLLPGQGVCSSILVARLRQDENPVRY